MLQNGKKRKDTPVVDESFKKTKPGKRNQLNQKLPDEQTPITNRIIKNINNEDDNSETNNNNDIVYNKVTPYDKLEKSLTKIAEELVIQKSGGRFLNNEEKYCLTQWNMRNCIGTEYYRLNHLLSLKKDDISNLSKELQKTKKY